MPAKLTTHVLDLQRGLPAAGIKVELWRLEPQPHLLKTALTNGDGRTDAPLLSTEEMASGVYELIFGIGDYFGHNISEIAFLDRVPIRFGIGEPSKSYHVALLVTPWAYQTYRGS